MNALGSASPERRRWRRTLRTGLFWTALGFGAACISYACDPDVAARSLGFDRALSILFLALVPIPALALGVHGLALALRLRAAAGLADRTAEELATLLPEGFVVVPHYRPSDGGDDEVPLLVVGPRGVAVIEPREVIGEVVCCQDQWYGKRNYGVGRRLAGASASQLARWNASRVRSDIATGGFSRTTVYGLVVFTRATLADVSSSCVPAFAGLDALVAHLEHDTPPVGRDRSRAVADLLAPTPPLAAA